MRQKNEDGFTLLEIIVTCVVSAIFLTLGAAALRTYWLKQSLRTAQGEAKQQMQTLQEQAVSESNPLVYGMRYTVGSSNWSIVQFDGKNASTTADDTCVTVGDTRSFNGVKVTAASFDTAPTVTATCISKLTAGAMDRFVFFYPRGTATSGSVTLTQESLNQSEQVTVTSMTGRVEAP